MSDRACTRRRVLALLTSGVGGLALAGCSGGPGGDGGTDDGNAGGGRADTAEGGQENTAGGNEPGSTVMATDAAASGADATAGEGTTGTAGDCSPVDARFDVPDVEKPASVDEGAAADVAERVETAYRNAVAIDPSEAEAVPDDVDRFDLDPAGSLGATTERTDGGYRVELETTARYGYDGSESGETAYTADRPITGAVYVVTGTGVRRVRGVGGLTGWIVCW